jgi:chaperonin GroEL (HSP60 family)
MSAATELALLTERDDLRDLLHALRDALDAGVRAKAIHSAITAVLDGAATEVEAAMILRRLAQSKTTRTAREGDGKP